MKSKKEKNLESTLDACLENKCDSIVFNGNMRRTFIEGVVQDMKGYFESRSNGLVEVVYEDYNLKGHEFGFKIFVVKTAKCSKQLFSEVASAVVNTANYMFSAGNDQYDISIFSENDKIEIEIVSNW